MTDTVILYGNMKWFDAAEEPEDIMELPSDFMEARKLFVEDIEANFEKIITLISPYLRARYVPCNLSNWEEIFSVQDMAEIEAEKIRIIGVRWDGVTFPTCKAEAIFRVPITHQFADVEIDDWQENNGLLFDGVVFYWDVPRSEKTAELDFTFGSHLGVECAIMDADNPF